MPSGEIGVAGLPVRLLDIDARAVTLLLGGEDNALAVGQPAGPAMVKTVVGDLLGVAGAAGQQDELCRRSHGEGQNPLAIGR